MLTTLLTALALTVPANETAVPVKAVDQLAIKAKTIWLGDGRSIEDGVVLIAGGKIERVGRGVEIPDSAIVIEHDGVLTAGMLALRSYTGAEDDVSESTRTVTANCDLIHAFNPSHSDFANAAQSGITSVVLTPPGSSIAGGVTCVVKTAGGGGHETARATRALDLLLGASFESLPDELRRIAHGTRHAIRSERRRVRRGQIWRIVDIHRRCARDKIFSARLGS